MSYYYRRNNKLAIMTILQKHLVFIPLCFIAFIALFGWIVMLLWNWLMPSIFGLPTLCLCQAIGLLLLCKILFGGISGVHGHHHGCHGHHKMCHGEDNKLREHWENMTPEERNRIVEQHKGSCCEKDGSSSDGE